MESSVPKSPVFRDRHGHFNGHLGKIAHFWPTFYGFARNFVIFVIVNGFRYAKIKDINYKTSDKTHQ